MVANVVSIDNGAIVPVQGTVSQNLVACLERLLEEAKNGEIVGIAGAVVHPAVGGTHQLSSMVTAGFVDGYGVIGALECVKHQIVCGHTEGEEL